MQIKTKNEHIEEISKQMSPFVVKLHCWKCGATELLNAENCDAARVFYEKGFRATNYGIVCKNCYDYMCKLKKENKLYCRWIFKTDSEREYLKVFTACGNSDSNIQEKVDNITWKNNIKKLSKCPFCGKPIIFGLQQK